MKGVDRWTFVHVVAGFVLGKLGVGLALAVVILAGFEVLEAFLRRTPGNDGKGLFEFESAQNILADVAFGLLGYWAAK